MMSIDQAAAGSYRGELAAGEWAELAASDFLRFGRYAPAGMVRWIQLMPQGEYDLHLLVDDAEQREGEPDPFERSRCWPKGATYVERIGLEGMTATKVYVRAYLNGEPAAVAVNVEIWAGFSGAA